MFVMFIFMAMLFVLVNVGSSQKSNSVRQVWEYKLLSRSRGIDSDPRSQDFAFAQNFDRWREDGKNISARDMLTKLAELGGQGWEVVSVITRSDNGNSYTSFDVSQPSSAR
jgi:hypothetical protein